MHTAEDTKYQGWANWETWNVALWFGNEEPLYRAVRAHFKKHGKFNAQAAKTFVQLQLPRGTADFRSAAYRDNKPIGKYAHDAYERVDWKEIADDFNEMGGG